MDSCSGGIPVKDIDIEKTIDDALNKEDKVLDKLYRDKIAILIRRERIFIFTLGTVFGIIVGRIWGG